MSWGDVGRYDRDVAEVISSGSWFHVWGPETENARMPIVDSLTAGSVRRLVTAERRARRPGRSATGTMVPCRYRGAIPFMTLYFVGQQSDLVLYALWYPQPVETDQCISDVITYSCWWIAPAGEKLAARSDADWLTAKSNPQDAGDDGHGGAWGECDWMWECI